MEYKKSINLADYTVGVIIGRFQTPYLHEGHLGLIKHVVDNHKKAILFLGISRITDSSYNPLDYISRRLMIQSYFPNLTILPVEDNRSDHTWSNSIDNLIRISSGEAKAVIYGSRDSFIGRYHGKNMVIELDPISLHSSTEIREVASRTIIDSSDWRSGVVYGINKQRPVTYPTVDVVAYNDKKEILLCKKSNEDSYRFIGGFVDRTDANYELAAKREFYEETSGSEIDELKYIASGQIKDWRYYKSQSGIMTTLFLGKFIFGTCKPSDDIALLHWLNPFEIDIEKDIMEEHRELFKKLLIHLDKLFK